MGKIITPTPEQVKAREVGHKYVGRGKACKDCALPKDADPQMHHPGNHGRNFQQNPTIKKEVENDVVSQDFAIDKLLTPIYEMVAGLRRDVGFLRTGTGPGTSGADVRTRPLIHSAIMEIMKAIGPIAKAHRYHGDTPGESFNFRLIDEMTAALQPILIANNVYATPRVLESWQTTQGTLGGSVLFCTRVRCAFTLTSALDGSKAEEAITEGEAHSLTQFSTNAAQTMAYKQFIWVQFCVPVLNADDPEGERDLPPVETVHSEPITPETEARQLDLLNREGEKLTGRRKVKRLADPTAETSRVVPSEPLSKGSVNIINAQLRSKPGLSEKMVAEHFGETELAKLKQSQLGDVRDFINAWVA